MSEKISPVIEDTLEAIYHLSSGKGSVRSVDIAEWLKVSKSMIHKSTHTLTALELIDMKPYGEIALTEKGEKEALKVIYRHKSIKDFLVNVLCVAEETADRDACKIEHSISKETLEKIVEYSEKLKKRENA